MPTPPITGKVHESGYALLMVFLLAATIAIGFYAVVPRVAFESQRDKEQLLVDRGEQYKRAIQLYYRKFRKYPVKMDDLENTSNIRFLRRWAQWEAMRMAAYPLTRTIRPTTPT